jgi:hypothetical protein
METITMHYCVTRSSLKIKLTHTVTGLLMCGTFQGKYLFNELFSYHVLLALNVEDIDGIRNSFKAAIYARYHTILYYITILYFIFLFFLVLYHTHTQYVGENVCCNEEC